MTNSSDQAHKTQQSNSSATPGAEAPKANAPEASIPNVPAGANSTGKEPGRSERAKGLSKKTWAVLLGVAALVAFFLDLDKIQDYIERRRPPRIDIRFYEKRGDKLSLAPAEGPRVEINERSLQQNVAEIPIYLAFHNSGEKRLDVVRMEIEYPHDLSLSPGGKAKIDPKGNKLIYEHELEILEPSESFTPVKEVDTIRLPMRFIFQEFITLLKDGVPAYSRMLMGIGAAGLKEMQVPMAVAIFCKDRAPRPPRIPAALGACCHSS